MKKLLQNSGLALMLALGMSSCSISSEWYYQVCNMQADQSWVEPGTENNPDQPFSGANADCRVEYDLWGEGGNLNSDITNNTERNIYVYLPECFVITNGYSNDYYRDEEVQVGAKRVRSPKVVCIPPHTTKSLQCKYAINNGLFADCNFDMFPKKQSAPVKFHETNSPLVVENLIAYSYTPDCKELIRWNHKFWLESITNYSENALSKKYEYEDCLHKDSFGGYATGKWTFRTKISPRVFYNTYEKKNTHLWRLKVKNTDKDKTATGKKRKTEREDWHYEGD